MHFRCVVIKWLSGPQVSSKSSVFTEKNKSCYNGHSRIHKAESAWLSCLTYLHRDGHLFPTSWSPLGEEGGPEESCSVETSFSSLFDLL